MSKFRLHWLDGKTEVVEGTDIADACTHAGYGAGAIRALDFYELIDPKNQEQNDETSQN